MNYLTDEQGLQISPRNPLDVRDVGFSTDSVAISAESVTFITGAAGFARVVSLDKAPVMNKTGDKVGSFWRSQQNLVDSMSDERYSRLNEIPKITSITETAGSAACVIHNEQMNMEALFESPSGTKDYILVLRDPDGSTLHGWVAGVSASGDDYTFTVHSTAAGSTQDWNGSLANFDSADVRKCKYEVYYYDTSFAWVTGTILTNEVGYNPRSSDVDQLDAMSNGDFAIDYRRGRILYKKATTGTSDTCNYNTRAQTNVVVSGGVSQADDSAFTPGSSVLTPTGYMADETATDSVDEGDVGIPRMTLNRRTIDAGHYADDTALSLGGYGVAIGALADETSPDSVDEGDFGYLRMTLTRFLKTSMGDLIAGEDLTNNKMVVEHQYSYQAVITADTQVKASAGFLHSVTISCNDAAPTAGSIIIYDNTAESGTVVFNHTFTTTPFVPFTVILDYTMTTGIYVGFTTTADVNLSLSYR